jgi:protein O-GlcNAc transferase
VERPVYLPGFDCFQAPANAPSVGSLPALRKGFVTFACFNNSLKITPAILGLWAEILTASKTSRLLLKFKGGEDELVRKAFRDRLGSLGVDLARVEILGWKSAADHLALYNEADIGLDTHPFDGCITTLEALWMGVPVVSRVAAGSGYWTGRMGLSHLTRVGLECLAGTTNRHYVIKALALTRNLPALAKIRQSLRARMSAPGGLCDGKAYMQGVEQAYRGMWKEWCAKTRSKK